MIDFQKQPVIIESHGNQIITEFHKFFWLDSSVLFDIIDAANKYSFDIIDAVNKYLLDS